MGGREGGVEGGREGEIEIETRERKRMYVGVPKVPLDPPPSKLHM